MNILAKKLSEKAKLPFQAVRGDAGYDLFATEGAHLRPQERKLFPTDISLEIPYGYYGRIAPRSGLALKKGLDVLAGIIDHSYRGNIGVLLYNTNGGGEENSVQIKEGDKIAQIIIERCEPHVRFAWAEELSFSDRGAGGFGSTG